MIHRHHRKRRSQGGGDDPVNVIEIPDALHERIHQEPEWAYENGLLVREWQDPAEVQIRLPEDVVTVKKPKKAKSDTPRPRAVVSIKVPKDNQEDGAEVLQTLIDECRKELSGSMGWKDDVPVYFVLCAVLADWLAS